MKSTSNHSEQRLFREEVLSFMQEKYIQSLRAEALSRRSTKFHAEKRRRFSCDRWRV